jgi:hypothetical protein
VVGPTLRYTLSGKRLLSNIIRCQGDTLLYLDPHHVRPVVPLRDHTSYSFEDLASYQCSDVRSISIHSLDPSCVVGFYCRSASDFEDLDKRLQELEITSGKTPLFAILDEFVECEDEIFSDFD